MTTAKPASLVQAIAEIGLNEDAVRCCIEADLGAAYALFRIEVFGPRLDCGRDLDLMTIPRQNASCAALRAEFNPASCGERDCTTEFF